MNNEEIEMNLAEQLQQECHDFINNMKAANPKISREAAESVWLYQRLAKIERRLHCLENNNRKLGQLG